MAPQRATGSGLRSPNVRATLELTLLWVAMVTVLVAAQPLIDLVRELVFSGASLPIASSLTGAALLVSFMVVHGLFAMRRFAGRRPAWSWMSQAVTWLIVLRWLAVVGAAAVVYWTTTAGRVVDPTTTTLWILIGLLAGFNGLLSFLGPKRVSSPGAVTLQVSIDTGLVGAAIHAAGGMSNPFVGQFVFPAMVAGLLLDRRQAQYMALTIAGFVLLVAGLELSNLLHPGCLLDITGRCKHADALAYGAWGLTAATLILGAALIVSFLADELRRSSVRLARTSGSLAVQSQKLHAARANLVFEQQKLHSIVSCMADAVIFASPDGKVLFHNGRATELWPDKPGAETDLEVCHSPERWNEIQDRLRNPALRDEHPVLTIGNRSFEATTARVTSPDGDLLGSVMIARDITDRLHTQRLVLEQEKTATVGRMSAALAHELNNPLSAIKLFTQVARKDLDDEQPLAQHLDTVNRNAELCTKIVRELLDYARPRRPEQREIAIADLMADVVRTLEPHGSRGNIDIRCDVAVDDEALVFGDPYHLRQILINLGLNGIDAMPGGGSLTLAAESRPGEETILRVTDTGTGISEADRARIFELFYTTKAEGTGLGLAVVRDLVSAHGGTLEVTSVEGEGSTFAIRLPPQAPASRTNAS